MNGLNTTVAAGEFAALRERKRLLDDAWLLTLFVILLATAVPWFLRIMELDLAPLAWSLFGFGLIYLATALTADRLQDRRSLLLILGALQAVGVLFLGFLWHCAGGLQNPMFLLVFVLPVVGGSLISRWQSYTSALLAVAAVAAVTFVEARELWWYVAQMGLPVSWLTDFLSDRWLATGRPFPGFYAPPPYYFVLLELFAILLFGIALMSEVVTSFLLKLYARVGFSASALAKAQILATEMLQAAPAPTVLIYSDTFNVVHASKSFVSQLLLTPESLLEKNLFGLVEFSYPDVVEGLITGGGGEAPFCVYRVGKEMRISRVRVYPLVHEGMRYAHVSLEDVGDTYYLRAALDALVQASFVIGPDGRVLCFNEAARELFGGLALGTEASRFLVQGSLPDGWWVPGLRGNQERQVELGEKPFAARSVSVPLPGEQVKLTVLTCVRAKGGK